MIIKSFRKKGYGFFGQNAESWAQSIKEVRGLLELAKDADKDRLSPFFKKYFPYPPKKILDGGCSIGKHVFAYRKLGCDIIGVDFAGDILKRAKKEVDETLPVYVANVIDLPFKDNFFDCYYSGGVIEHFEDGPDAPIKEARRVLKKGGLFLVTVPYINILRRLFFSFFPDKKGDSLFQKRCKRCQSEPAISAHYNFCEYFFDVSSLTPYFKANGFLIERTYPTDFLYGELGLPLQKFGLFCHSYIRNRRNRTDSQNRTDQRLFILKAIYDFFITENRENIFYRLPLTLLNYISGHLILFIARAV